jgi:hypothetical protein
MSLVMPTIGKTRALELIVGQAAPDNLTLHLFSNNIHPSIDDTRKLYHEVNGGGYTSKILDGNDWLITGETAEYPSQEFLFSGLPSPFTIFGYFIMQGDVLLWAERFTKTEIFEAPFVVTGLGDKIIITPVFTLQEQESVLT